MMVFDSSGLVAYVRDETGAEAVGELLEEADVPKFIHAANLCEVFHLLMRSDGRAFAEETVRDFARLGITERGDMDGALWRDAASLIAARRLAGASLPLGDALGVALARRLGAEFVTADRHELEALEDAGEADFIFIR
jgi:PIN domain nuclease of toxin-antitoxin system